MIKYLLIDKDGKYSLKESNERAVLISEIRNKSITSVSDGNQKASYPYVDSKRCEIQSIHNMVTVHDEHDELKNNLLSKYNPKYYDIKTQNNIDGTTTYKFSLNYLILEGTPIYDIVEYFKTELNQKSDDNKNLINKINVIENTKNMYLKELDKYKKLYNDSSKLNEKHEILVKSYRDLYESPLLYQIIFLLKVWVMNLFKFK